MMHSFPGPKPSRTHHHHHHAKPIPVRWKCLHCHMGKVTITLLVLSTALLLIAFTKGINLLHGGADVLSHLYWALAALLGALTANFFAIFHAAQSDRII